MEATRETRGEKLERKGAAAGLSFLGGLGGGWKAFRVPGWSSGGALLIHSDSDQLQRWDSVRSLSCLKASLSNLLQELFPNF